MVKYIHSSDNQNQAAIACMAENLTNQNQAEVGLFWYDTNKCELFGVNSTPADALEFYHSSDFNTDVKTDGRLHKSIWQKEFHRGKDSRFLGDYTQVPRGRVFEFKDVGYVVYTGTWINKFPQAKAQILFEFNLPEDTEFRTYSHWELGHGWSNDI